MNSKQKQSKKRQLIVLYGHYCWWCGYCLKENELTIEHLYPQSLGGSNSFENLRLSCFKCNNSRGNSVYPPNWRKANCF